VKISPSHPRFKSLTTRERLVKGFHDGIVVPQGLIAHGRGEAFDYLLGEITPSYTRAAIRAAGALLLSARNPVVSVNGNVAALVSRDVVRLANAVGAQIEVNLFHRSSEREEKIAARLKRDGAKRVLGVDASKRSRLQGIASPRREADSKGIVDADVVLIPLEDGDRAEALVKAGKKVIAIDLNPMSRTSQAATVTIVDNVIRALPELRRVATKLANSPRFTLKKISLGFDNKKNLSGVMKELIQYVEGWTKK